MAQYAEKTKVSVSQSKAEIEKTLKRYGATGFMYGWEEDRAAVGFKMNSRQVRFVLPLPAPSDKHFSVSESGRKRTTAQATAAFEQAERQRWRALALVIKAKLEAVETGITGFEDEFLAHIVLPDGSTVGDFMKPQIAVAYDKGDMPKLLAAPK